MAIFHCYVSSPEGIVMGITDVESRVFLSQKRRLEVPGNDGPPVFFFAEPVERFLSGWINYGL